MPSADQYTVTDLDNDVLYEVSIAAVNSIGVGPYSNVITATPTGPPNPDPPANLYATQGEILDFEVTWSQPTYTGDSPFSHYTLFIQNAYNPNDVLINSQNYNSTSYYKSPIEGTYNVYVTVVNQNGKQSTVATTQAEAIGP